MDLERDRRQRTSPDENLFLFSGDTLTHLAYDQEEIHIPDHCRAIGVCAFADNLYVERVLFPPSVKIIGDGAFINCMYLNSLQLAEGLEEIGASAFQDTGISRLELPGTLRRIGPDAFSACPLTEVVLPEGLVEVGPGAFLECYDLRSATIPDSLTDLAEDAFDFCPKLRHIHASRRWEEAHPDLCRQLAQQLRQNFLQNAAYFCLHRNISLTAELEEALQNLASIFGLIAIQEAMDAITARLRQLDRTPPKMRILRNALRCRLCGEEIESGYRHDFVMCRCGACGVDGGREYLRRIGIKNDYTDLAEEIPVNKEDFL